MKHSMKIIVLTLSLCLIIGLIPNAYAYSNSGNSLSCLPTLNGIPGVFTVGSGNLPVYTGPGMDYYRSASGKAAVGSGESVTVYGRVDDWVFIQYNAWYTSKNMYVTRFAYIPANQIERGPKYFEVQFASIPISISAKAMIGDEPSTTHYYNSFSSWENNSAIALARIYINGYNWIYFESYAHSSQGYRPFRGFVQEQYVSLR